MNNNINKILNITIIGHVDCGKSTLCGQILYRSGIVSNEEINKLKLIAKEKKMDSWYLAYLTDTTNEERDKGKTIEYSINNFYINDLKINLIDSPGHKNYIQNTLQALFISDIAILVVSAKEGEFESGFEKLGQTKEHLIISKGSGINNIIVVINKIDDQTIINLKERIEYIKNKLDEYIKKLNLNIIEYIEISALNNINIENKLFDTIYKSYDKINFNNNDINNTELMIIEKFNNINNYLMVKIKSNNYIDKNNILYFDDNIIELSSLYDKNMIKINKAYMNDIIIIQIKEKDYSNLNIGDFLSNKIINLSKNNYKIKAKIKIIDKINNIPIISNGYNFYMDINLKSINCTINNIYDKLFLKVGDVNYIDILFNEYININYKNFIMRNNGKIIGIGIIL